MILRTLLIAVVVYALLLIRPSAWLPATGPVYGQADAPGPVHALEPDAVAQNHSLWYSPHELNFGAVGVNSLGPYAVQLQGEGRGAQKTVTPIVLDFGPLPLNRVSPPQQVYIYNSGVSALNDFVGGGVGPPFTVSQSCTGGVSPGAQCSYTFRYAPTESGLFTAVSQTESNAGPFTIQLSGGMAPPMLAATFAPRTIKQDGTARLEFTITNPNPNLALTGVSVVNNLPPGLLVKSAGSASVSEECGAPLFSPQANDTSLTFSEGIIEGGETCLVRVNVSVTAPGDYANRTNPVRADTPAGQGNRATANLTVIHDQYLPKVHK